MQDAKVFVPGFYVAYVSKIRDSALTRLFGRRTHDARCMQVKTSKPCTHQPWRPPTFHGRHGAPLTAPPNVTISQNVAQQDSIVKTKNVIIITLNSLTPMGAYMRPPILIELRDCLITFLLFCPLTTFDNFK
jgi:hypothetical protein